MDVNERLKGLSQKTAKDRLIDVLTRYCDPAFGSLPKREIDLLMFELLRDLGAVPKSASLFDLMKDLRITRTKARDLLYDIDVRRADRSPDKLDSEVQILLGSAQFSRDGGYFVIEIEDPLLQAHLRERVRKLRHVSDTSFNSSLVRLSLDAVSDLTLELLTKDERKQVFAALVAAGATDKTLKGALKGAFGKLAGKIAGKAGDELASEIVDQIGKYLGPVFTAAGDEIRTVWPSIFGKKDKVGNTRTDS